MGKPTGFLEHERRDPEKRPATERVADWAEFQRHRPDDELRRQGARCMDCGIPFCHSGIVLAGMASGCPIHNRIPEWNDLVYRGKWREALENLQSTNNFPEFTGRVCPAPCEGACVLGINAPAVAIKSIEAAIVDRGFDEGWIVPNPPERRTGRRVAVVGSGPAGLACADQLNRAGHLVTVLERDDRIGGLLTYGIPPMKLDKSVVERRLALLRAEGITFQTRTEVGRDYPATRLFAEFDAVVLCCGATRARDLDVEGRKLTGIHLAMDFLHQSTRSLLDSGHADGSYIDASGKDVVVIGGGDTGTDCVATSLRHGCRSVRQLEILERPPEVRAGNNPWPQWPRTYLLDYGQAEAAARFGGDPRRFATMTRAFRGDADGQVTGLETVAVRWEADALGQRRIEEVPGTEEVIPADLVLLALGFLGPENRLLDVLGVARDERTNVLADHGDFGTSVEGVFAAGDCRRGQSLVVWAIEEGRGAARECDRYLMGETRLP